MGKFAFQTFVESLIPRQLLTISPIEILGSALAIGILLFLSTLSVATIGDPLFVDRWRHRSRLSLLTQR